MKKCLFSICIALFALHTSAQISAPTATVVQTTAYTNGATNDPIYIFCSPTYNGNTLIPSLTATPSSGVPGWTFEWFIYSMGTNSWVPYTTQTNQPSSTITGLASGGYRVVIKDANNNVVGCSRAWVWHKQNTVDVQPVASGCGAFSLNGSMNTDDDFTYYNPPPDPFIIDASTIITVCFSATHTYVSDLGFYLVSPGGGTVLLSPNPGANGQNNICNSGNNVNGLCFTTVASPNFNPCSAGAPYTGTYSTYGPGNTPINWSTLYGQDATQGGWQVQIYDCIGADVGALTNASITFTGMSSCGPSTITYNSGNINSIINDNSCSPQTASIYVVPPPPPTVASTIHTTTTYYWTSNPPYSPGGPSGTGPVLPWNIDPPPTEDTWFYITAVNSIGCSVIDSTFFDYVRPTPPQINEPMGPICENGMNIILTADSIGGVWHGTGITDTINGIFNPQLVGAGIHQVTYTTPAPCGGADTIMVTVFPKPNVNYTGPTSICGTSGFLTASATIPAPFTIATYNWFIDGQAAGTGDILGHTFAANPTQTVNGYVISSSNVGCVDTANFAVLLQAVPDADFTFDDNCVGLTIPYTNTSTWIGTPAPGTTLTYAWTMGDATASADENPTHTYTQSGTYNVTLILTASGSGCTDTITYPVVASNLPEAAFVTAIQCFQNVLFTSSSNDHGSGIDVYNWDLDDGTTANDSSFYHEYENPGTYHVTLTITNAEGCSSTVSMPILIDPSKPISQIAMPNILTPNGDGTNDNLLIDPAFDACNDYEITIFNRWGTVVYRQEKGSQPFHGISSLGSKLSSGVYFYSIRIGDNDKNGTITIAY